MTFNACIAFLLLIFNVGAAIAGSMEDIKARGELVVGVKTDYPPYGFKDAEEHGSRPCKPAGGLA